MALTIVELYEALKRLDETGLLDSVDGEVVVAYQPNYPLVAAATGCGFIVKDGAVWLRTFWEVRGHDRRDTR